MSVHPLAPVVDYQTMLNRIFWFTSASALAAIWMLRLHIPALDGVLSEIDFTVEFGGNKVVPVPGGFLLPALAVGIVTRIYRVHARISNWLGIRECFDVQVILGEFADQLAIDLTSVTDQQLVEWRHSLMRRIFYPYVSGPHPQIDPHLIQQALDAWSWLWIGIEATLVFVLTGLGLIGSGAYPAGFQILSGTLVVATIGLPAMRGQCKRYAVAQVRAILADPARVADVRTAFAELIRKPATSRLAA
jgi:hypothetical protein